MGDDIGTGKSVVVARSVEGRERFRLFIDTVTCVAGLALAIGAGARVAVNLWTAKDIDPSTPALLLIGLVATVWPTVESFKTPFGEFKRRLEQVAHQQQEKLERFAGDKIQDAQKRIEETAADEGATEAKAARPKASSSRSGGASADAIDAAQKKLPPPTEGDDPQSGRFGEDHERRGKKLSARVTGGGDGWYRIYLNVRSTDPVTPFAGKVRFFLHDTFEPDTVDVTALHGVARLKLQAYGAFTVGALCGDGTPLELYLGDEKLVSQPDDKFRFS